MSNEKICHRGSAIAFVLAYFLVSISIFSIDLVIASLAPDVKRAGFICSVVNFPMLLFSGTTVPFSVFPESAQSVASLLPLTQGIKLLNGVSTGGAFGDYAAQVFVLTAIALAGIGIALKFFQWDMR